MADVTARRSAETAGRERAQLVLATALVLATLFVVLALVLNAVIYTENFSTRADANRDVREPMQVRDVAREDLERAVIDTNRQDASYATLHADFGEEVRIWNDLAVRHRVVSATDLELTVADVTDGTRIIHDNDTLAFTNVSDAPDWQLVSGATGVRSFRANVSASSLVEPGNTSTPSDLNAAGVFRITITDSTGDVWGVYVYAAGPNVTVRVAEPDGTLRTGCSAAPDANDRVAIEVTAGRVGDADCDQLGFVDGLSTPIDIQFDRGDNASGTYSLVVDLLETTVDDGDFAAGNNGPSPYTTRVIYSADVDLRYAAPSVEYRTRIAVQPEVDDD